MAERSLTVTWQDPRGLAARATEGSGLDFLRAIISGELPKAPIQELVGFELEEADEGRVLFTIEPGEQHYNPIGSVETGRVLAEGKVIHRGKSVATVEGSLRAAEDDKLLAHGTSTCLIR